MVTGKSMAATQQRAAISPPKQVPHDRDPCLLNEAPHPSCQSNEDASMPSWLSPVQAQHSNFNSSSRIPTPRRRTAAAAQAGHGVHVAVPL